MNKQIKKLSAALRGVLATVRLCFLVSVVMWVKGDADARIKSQLK